MYSRSKAAPLSLDSRSFVAWLFASRLLGRVTPLLEARRESSSLALEWSSTIRCPNSLTALSDARVLSQFPEFHFSHASLGGLCHPPAVHGSHTIGALCTLCRRAHY